MGHYDQFRKYRSDMSDSENSHVDVTYSEPEAVFHKSRRYITLYKHVHEIAPTVTIPQELLDFLQVLQDSANAGKYPADNWLDEDGRGCGHKEMHASMFRHLANSCAGNRLDNDSGRDHLLHLAARAMMLYVRLSKGFEHPTDKGNVK